MSYKHTGRRTSREERPAFRIRGLARTEGAERRHAATVQTQTQTCWVRLTSTRACTCAERNWLLFEKAEEATAGAFHEADRPFPIFMAYGSRRADGRESGRREHRAFLPS